jgi:outer-membrane receptor for ferric coprogen and ferric-rhodotorulic acid
MPTSAHPLHALAWAAAIALAPALARAQAATAPAPAASAAETVLPTVRVEAPPALPAKTEGSGSYTTGATAAATGLTLSLRDTPQSVTVITRERMDDQAMPAVADALVSTTGVSLKAVDRGRNNLSVRGFDVTNFLFDGIPFATGNIGIEEQNSVVYDRVEVEPRTTSTRS